MAESLKSFDDIHVARFSFTGADPLHGICAMTACF